MTYDVVYQLRGDAVPMRVAAVVRTPKAAWAAARKVLRKEGVVHVTITCDDGTTLYDTRRDCLSIILP